MEDLSYRFEEMKEAMDASLENAKSVIKEQQILLEVVQNSGRGELDEFAEELEEQIEKMNGQVAKLEEKRTCLEYVILSLGNEKIKNFSNNLCAAIGLFE